MSHTYEDKFELLFDFGPPFIFPQGEMLKSVYLRVNSVSPVVKKIYIILIIL